MFNEIPDFKYSAYIDFCNSVGRESHKKHGFMRTLRARGIEEGRNNKTREATWKGITLKKFKKGDK